MKTTRLSLAGLLFSLLSFLGAVQCDCQSVDDELTLCIPEVAESLAHTSGNIGNIGVISNPLAQVECDQNI